MITMVEPQFRIKALILDFDGLILDTEYPEYLSWYEIFQDYGLEFSASEWAAYIGRGADEAIYTPYDMLEARTGLSIDRTAIRSRRQIRFNELMQAEEVLPGVVDLINTAKGLDIKLAVASSSDQSWVKPHLSNLDLIHHFDLIRCGDEVTHRKPNPELYLSVLEALDITRHEAIAFEDSPNGIAAAVSAGILCVAVPNRLTIHGDLTSTDVLVNSLKDFSLHSLLSIIPDPS